MNNFNQFFMDNFDLNKFLKNYKPVDATDKLHKYLKLIPDYMYMTLSDKKSIIPNKTLIKYMANDIDLNNNKDKYERKKDIKHGGLVLAVGNLVDKKFVAIDEDKIGNNWSYIKLRMLIKDDYDNTEMRIFFIKITNFYVFYKILHDKDKELKKYMIKLLKKE